MKSRILPLASALLVMAFAAPWSFAGSSKDTTTKDPKASADQASTVSPTPVAEPDPDKVKHDGGADDVDAIGNRNVGCDRGLGTGTASKARSKWVRPMPCRWSRNRS